MENDVNNLIELWKDSYSNSVKKYSPYRVTHQLRQIASLFSPGMSYYYVMNFHNLEFEYISEGVKDVTGYTPEEITIEKILKQTLLEDRAELEKKEQATSDFVQQLKNPKDMLNYKVMYTYRIKDKKNNIKTILIQNTILSVSQDGGMEHVLGVHTDITHLGVVKNKGISFIHLNGGRSYYNIDFSQGKFDPSLSNNSEMIPLTKREIEIAELLAKGFSAVKIGEILNISDHTVRTHRKKMLRKLNCSNTTELIVQCIASGVIKC